MHAWAEKQSNAYLKFLVNWHPVFWFPNSRNAVVIFTVKWCLDYGKVFWILLEKECVLLRMPYLQPHSHQMQSFHPVLVLPFPGSFFRHSCKTVAGAHDAQAYHMISVPLGWENPCCAAIYHIKDHYCGMRDFENNWNWFILINSYADLCFLSSIICYWMDIIKIFHRTFSK